MKTSSVIKLESINTSLVPMLVDMPLKCSDGEMKMELITGSVLTHGTQAGEWTDSSKSKWEIATLMLEYMLANQT